jgi:hypothetical protein
MTPAVAYYQLVGPIPWASAEKGRQLQLYEEIGNPMNFPQLPEKP